MEADVQLDFLDLRMRDEELHPDLQARVYYIGNIAILSHRLLVTPMVFSQKAARENAVYKHALEVEAQALAEKNWSKYIFNHARPYRAQALRLVMDLCPEWHTRKSFWKLLGTVWRDSENVQEYDRFWRKVWAHKNARMTMSKTSLNTLLAMPKTIEVFHGLERGDDSTLGFSWTTKQDTAEWFARRFARQHDQPVGYVARGYVRQSSVRSYMPERGEWEIIAFPRNVKRVEITQINLK